MKKTKIIIGVSVGVAVLVGGYFAYHYFKKGSTKKKTNMPPISEGGRPSEDVLMGRPSIIGGMPVRNPSPEEMARQNA